MTNIHAGDPIVSKDRKRLLARWRHGIRLENGADHFCIAVMPSLDSQVPKDWDDAHALNQVMTFRLDYEAANMRVWRVIEGEEHVTVPSRDFDFGDVVIGPTAAGIAKAAETLLALPNFGDWHMSALLERVRDAYAARAADEARKGTA